MNMRWANIAAWSVLILQAVNMIQILLHDSMYHGVGNDYFNQSFKDYWGTFVSFDLMTGLVLFSTWLGWRESGSRLIGTVAWIWNILWWGNIVVAIYVLLAIYQSRGSILAFFAGNRSGETLREFTWHSTLAGRAISLTLAIGTALWLWQALTFVRFKGVPAFGLYAGFLPLVLALLLLAFARPPKNTKSY